MKTERFNYEGTEITLFQGDRGVMVNLTEVAKAFPEKNLSTIVNSQEIKEYVKKLAAIKNYIATDLLIVTNGVGTLAHQKVALRVCQKLSTEFAIWVDTKIEEFLQSGFSQLPQTFAQALQLAADQQLQIEEQQKQLENSNNLVKLQGRMVEYKGKVIKGLTQDIPTTEKRQILNRVVRYKGSNIQERWTVLYREFENQQHIDLKYRVKKYNQVNRTRLSKLDYIDVVLGRLDGLYACAVKIFESDVDSLVEEIYGVK